MIKYVVFVCVCVSYYILIGCVCINTTENSVPILEKARRAVSLCQSLLQHNYPRRRDMISSLKRQGSVPRYNTGSSANKRSSKEENKDDNKEEKDKESESSTVTVKIKTRTRSYSDVAVPKSAVFEDEMVKIIVVSLCFMFYVFLYTFFECAVVYFSAFRVIFVCVCVVSLVVYNFDWLSMCVLIGCVC